MSEHAKELEPKIKGIQDRIRKMAAEDHAGRLFQIIHKPGWTTLREVKLVQAALDAHARHLDEINQSLRALVDAAE